MFQAQAPRRLGACRRIWSRRRWLYGAYMLVAVVRIPARVHFHLVVPRCDTRLTVLNTRLSMTKISHMALFAVFFLLTVLQFDKLDGRAFRWSLLAAAGLGLLVELEEGASRTGNCRLTDVLPDVAGAAIVGILLLAMLILRKVLAPPTTPG
jgi:hypothetical protein